MRRITVTSNWALTGGLVALASGLLAGPAYASNECGAQTGATVTCTSTGNPYASGITYAAAQDLTLDLDPNVVVDTTTTGLRGLTIGGTRNTSDVTINALGSSIVTTGASATAVTVASGSGDLVLALGSITTSGANARGISAASSSGAVSVSAQSITTTGSGASAILAQSTTNTVAVTNDGTISTAGAAAYGIYARGPAGVTVDGEGSVSTSGDGANAIDAISSSGAVSVTQGSVFTSGAGSIGIRAGATADSDVTVGDVTATGAGADAISAFSLGEATSVSLTGSVQSTQAIGALISAATTATLNVAAGASLDGATGAASITSGTGTLINNAGTIGPVGAASLGAITITATGGPVTINNSGTINGNILVGDSDDVLTNTGVFNAVTNSDFNGGDDLLDNQGAFNVAPFATTATVVKLYALETFRNSGIIDFRNGHVGDLLSVQGDYVGDHGKIALDIDPSNLAASDTVQFGGAASGDTVISLNRLNDNPVELDSGTTLVKVGADSVAGAFTLDPATQGSTGLIGLGLKYDAPNLSYDLVAVPGDAAYRTLAISSGVRALWVQSADAWSARMQQMRDMRAASSKQPTSGIWGQLIGQRQTRDDSEMSTVFGVTRRVDLGYSQDEVGGQIGADIRSSADGTMTYGVTGGYLHSTLDYRHAADRLTFDDVNLGAYLGYNSGALFFNLLGKYDFYWAHNDSVSGGYSNKLNGSSYGAQAEFGARLGGDALFFEPSVSVAASHSGLKDFTIAEGRFDFDDPDGLALKAGGRIGSSFGPGGRTGSVYLRADYVDELIARDRVTFSSGGDAAALEADAPGAYGEAAIGVNLIGKSGFGLSLEGRYDKGGDSDGYGGRITLHAAF